MGFGLVVWSGRKAYKSFLSGESMNDQETKKNRRELIYIAAAIAFLVWVLLVLGVNSRAEAAAGLCESLTAEETEKLYWCGDNIKWCPSWDCASIYETQLLNDGYVVDNWCSSRTYSRFPGVWFYTFYKAATDSYVTIIYEDNSPPQYILEGCSQEGALRDKMMSWFLYVLSGIFFAWAFIKAIHTVNS